MWGIILTALSCKENWRCDMFCPNAGNVFKYCFLKPSRRAFVCSVECSGRERIARICQSPAKLVTPVVGGCRRDNSQVPCGNVYSLDKVFLLHCDRRRTPTSRGARIFKKEWVASCWRDCKQNRRKKHGDRPASRHQQKKHKDKQARAAAC